MKIEFKKKCSMQNGNKITNNNWHMIRAKSSEPCVSVRGVTAIDIAILNTGYYYETWHLKKEQEGYIFREISHNGGINGHHESAKAAVWGAIRAHISVFLED